MHQENFELLTPDVLSFLLDMLLPRGHRDHRLRGDRCEETQHRPGHECDEEHEEELRHWENGDDRRRYPGPIINCCQLEKCEHRNTDPAELNHHLLGKIL